MAEDAPDVLARLEQLELAMSRRFDQVDRHLTAMIERMELLGDKVDRASGVRHDTDRLLTGFARLKQRVDELERRQG